QASMARTLIAIVVLTMGLAPASRCVAGCNAFPPAGTATMVFNGSRGTLGSPFVIPTETLRITRRGCDGPVGTSFPSNSDDVRTIVVLRPPSGKVRVIVLKPGTTDGPCDTDAFTEKCQKEVDTLGTGGSVACFSVTKYGVTPNVVDVEFPDLQPNKP